MYVKVYAPNGDVFEVPEDRATYLRLTLGWTSSKPEIVTPAPQAETVTINADEDKDEDPQPRSKRRHAAE